MGVKREAEPRPSVEVRGLTKAFGARTALQQVSLDVPGNGSVGIAGACGSGKSSLLRALAGRLRPDAGRVRVLGLDPIADARALLPRLGWVPSVTGFPHGLGVRDVGKLCRDLSGAGDPLLFAKLRTSFGLQAGARADALPPNARWMLSLALALQKAPEILLVDDLEESNRGSGTPTLADVAALAPAPVTIVAASREIARVACFTDRVLLMHSAQIVDGFDRASNEPAPVDLESVAPPLPSEPRSDAHDVDELPIATPRARRQGSA